MNYEKTGDVPDASQNKNNGARHSRREFLGILGAGLLAGGIGDELVRDIKHHFEQHISSEDEKGLEDFAEKYDVDLDLLKSIASSLRRKLNTKGITIRTDKFVFVCVLTKNGDFLIRALENQGPHKTKKTADGTNQI